MHPQDRDPPIYATKDEIMSRSKPRNLDWEKVELYEALIDFRDALDEIQQGIGHHDAMDIARAVLVKHGATPSD